MFILRHIRIPSWQIVLLRFGFQDVRRAFVTRKQVLPVFRAEELLERRDAVDGSAQHFRWFRQNGVNHVMLISVVP